MTLRTASTSPMTYKPSPCVLQVLPALKDGGVEQSTLEMTHYLSQQGWKALAASAGGAKTHLISELGGRHIPLPLHTKTPWGILWNAVRISQIIRGENVSLIHARSRAPAWSAWLASRMTGVPYVTTFHGTYGLKGGMLKRFYNSVMIKGPIVIANSQFIKRHILKNYQVNDKTILVAARGIEPEQWNPDNFTPDDRHILRSELDVSDSTPLLLMVGRITRWKGHDLVLESLGQLPDVPWVLAIAGEIDKNSEYGEELKMQASRLGIADRVRWLGSRTDIPRLLSASQLAISGSTRPEAFGRVAIEAMAMGVPIVATGIGGSLETVIDGKTGWLVKPDPELAKDDNQLMFGEFRPQAMASILRKALLNPHQLITMGHTARAHVLRHFTVEQCCAAEMEAYKMVLEHSVRP